MEYDEGEKESGSNSCGGACNRPGLPAAAVFAETSRTEAQIREVQEAIVDWEMERNESDQLLTGELLDNADGSESQWFAFAASRIGIEDNQAQYLARLQQVVEYYYANLEAEKENLKATDWAPPGPDHTGLRRRSHRFRRGSGGESD